jgi:hypothetical protein
MTQPRQQRVNTTFPVRLHAGRTAALSVDISSGGFCLESPSLLPTGAEVSGTVIHGPLQLAFTGRVVWSKAGGPMASTWHRMGVQLERVSPGLRALFGLTMRS